MEKQRFGKVTISDDGIEIKRLLKKNLSINWTDILHLEDNPNGYFLFYKKDQKSRVVQLPFKDIVFETLDSEWRSRLIQLLKSDQLSGTSYTFGSTFGLYSAPVLGLCCMFIFIYLLSGFITPTFRDATPTDPIHDYLPIVLLQSSYLPLTMLIVSLSILYLTIKSTRFLEEWENWDFLHNKLCRKTEAELEFSTANIQSLTSKEFRINNKTYSFYIPHMGYVSHSSLLPHLLYIQDKQQGREIPVERDSYRATIFRMTTINPLIVLLLWCSSVWLYPERDRETFPFWLSMQITFGCFWGFALYLYIVEIIEQIKFKKEKKRFFEEVENLEKELSEQP